MSITRRTFGACAASAPFILMGRAAKADDVEPFRFAVGSKTITTLLVSFVVPEYLGYYREEGLTVEIATLGSNAATTVAADQGRFDAFVGVPSFYLPVLAEGKTVNVVNYFEYVYPFKWSFVVRPGSPYKSIADLRGKKIGVVNFGTSDHPVGKSVLRLVGIDPDKDVTWLATGEGVTSGYALQKGDVDALFGDDVNNGAVEGAGIKLEYLPLPPNVAKIGGLYLAAMPKMMQQKSRQLIGFARGVAKAQTFIVENPDAAAYIFIQRYPESAPRNKTMAQKVAAIAVPIRKRLKFFKHYDPRVTDWGYISISDVKDDIAFMNVEGKLDEATVAAHYTNDLIKEINAFDREAIRTHAREFKLPY